MKKVAVLLSTVLLAATLTGCAKSAQVSIKGIADLEGKKIGVQSGTTGEAWTKDNSKASKVLSYKSGIDAALDLKNGAIDAIVLDELPAIAIANKNPDLIIVRDPEFAANKEEYAIAIKKGNTELVESINNTINKMKANGDYSKLVNDFMPVDGNIKIPEISSEGSTKIKLGTNATFPPFEYVDGKDIVGFDITMGHYIAKDLNKSLEVINIDFDALITALQADTIDFIAAGMSVTEERKQNVDFSVPYYASEQVIIIRK